MKLNYFKEIKFLPAIKALLKELNVPVNYISDEPASAKEILEYTYKDNETFQLIEDVYFVGMVDDAAFEGNESFDHKKIKSDYDGILFFGIELTKRENNLLPTRTQLADIARAFNREFHFTPVVVVFKYANEDESFISFANTERIKYKQEWREGEKAGKVSLLRDISIEKPHRGHEDIINALRITTSGKKAIRSFDALYKYWQEVFSVNILNKKFYQELSNWYFWAIKNVTFPSEPTLDDVIKKYGQPDHDKLAELINEHNATNVIRLLTRLLFTWFIKEKKLIPESLFDLDALQDDILKEINPYQQEGMFKHASKDSIYYKAILQNLFFASLNCPIEADAVDKRKRGFRGDGYGTHRGIDYLMRYKKQFKNPVAFLDLMNETVPFLNGGLFECLDDKYQNIYIDGFSDQMTQGQRLIVPDFLFFGLDTEVDLSQDYGSKNKKYKKAAVKGLINILKSYKFTITENTPIEEDVALDPELLGKVFENLLASYNPETKSTARKQTGSFYTPREIVNYMVDESLIAYLKNAIDDWGMEENEVDDKLHVLTSFDPVNPFEDCKALPVTIIKALDNCKILDPACGSGAFPMGILQKMVHILQKLDPTNEHWKEVQLEKAIQASKEAYGIEDKQERENRLIEINNAFDSNINDPDYARKLYLIENCIYGVDIQPIATQISKLRFFISLVVDQKKNNQAENFGIRALPNLETKFVTANTLIGIEKPSTQTSLYDTDSIKELERELKSIRHKLFGARTKDTKLKYRKKDEELRIAISEELKKSGWHNETADKLSSWDPYDQNASATFFDSEWMFDVKDGFDVVIANPPYVFTRDVDFDGDFKKYVEDTYLSKVKREKRSKANQSGKINLFAIFIMKGLFLSNKKATLTYIVPNNILRTTTYNLVRKYILDNTHVNQIVDLGSGVFDGVTASTLIMNLINDQSSSKSKMITEINDLSKFEFTSKLMNQAQFLENVSYSFNIYMDEKSLRISNLIKYGNEKLSSVYIENIEGIVAHKHLIIQNQEHNTFPMIEGKDIKRYNLSKPVNFIIWDKSKIHRTRPDFLWEAAKKIVIQRISGGKRPLVCVVDTEQFRSFASTNNIILKDEYNNQYYFFTAIINSRVVNWYYANNFTNNSNLTVNISKTFMDEIPIVVFNNTINTLSLIAHNCNLKSKEISLIENVIDAGVFNLYFTEHMEEKEIDVIDYIENDIQEVMKNRDFEQLSDHEKKQVIAELLSSWTHPDNEVRNRMKLFAVRSPDILKPILES